MTSIQDMARQGILPKEIAKCKPPMCVYCQFSKAHKKSSNKDNPIVKDDIVNPGDLIHMDQAVSSLPGRWLTASGKPSKKKCTTISIFVDSVSNKIFAEFQSGATAAETLHSKKIVEQQAFHENVKFKKFCADTGIYKSKEFHANIEDCGQTITFCGVGAHHQNGLSEQ
jgi:hypothetical protein